MILLIQGEALVHFSQVAGLGISKDGNMNIIRKIKYHVNTLTHTHAHTHKQHEPNTTHHILFSYCPVQLLVSEQSKMF